MPEKDQEKEKKVVVWWADARAELRALDRDTALTTGTGDVIKLQLQRFKFRLQVGDYRVISASGTGRNRSASRAPPKRSLPRIPFGLFTVPRWPAAIVARERIGDRPAG